MINRKPSSLGKIFAERKAKINKKHSFAKKINYYNQPTVTLQRTKKKTQSHEI